MDHLRDAEAWKTSVVGVEGGGYGQLVVLAANDTWRAILCVASAGRRIDVDHEGMPAFLVNKQARASNDSQSPTLDGSTSHHLATGS